MIRDLGEYMREWNDSFEFIFVDPEELTKQERAVFDKTPLILKTAGGQPSKVKEILISETMRLDECAYKETAGMYDTCKFNCSYGYATVSEKAMLNNIKAHNSDSPLLVGNADFDEPGLSPRPRLFS